ncbi:MAG: TM2 domain-containing protein [Ktedonobacterales bacterium]
MSVDLTQLTAHLSPEQQDEVKKAYRKKAEHPTAAFLWCFFLGTCGAHRFYLRQWGAGFARLIFPLIAAIVIVSGIVLQWPAASVAAIAIALLLIALIWEIIDLFRIDHEVYERNLRLAEELIAGTLLADHGVEQRALGRMAFLTNETESASGAAAHREERLTAAEAAADVPEPVAAVSETAAPGANETDETAESREAASTGAGIASAAYVASTVNEISADPGETQHGERLYTPEHKWSETTFAHAEDENIQTSEQSGEETSMVRDDLGVAAAGVGAAAVGGLALDELVTRSHEEAGHSATDSLETFTTVGAAESEQRDETVAAEGETASAQPPTTAESEALTWPDHPPVQFDEPAPVSATTADASKDAGGFDAAQLLGGALVGAAALGGVAALGESEEETPAGRAPYTDYTDLGVEPAAAPPIADVEGAAPHFVTLPDYAAVTSADTPTLQVEPATDATPGADDALLLLVPDDEANSPFFDAEPLSAAEETAPPPESYIPPTVPVVSVPSAEPISLYDAGAAPAELETGPIMPPPEPEPERNSSSGETLAELAGLAGGVGLAAGAAEMLHAHGQTRAEANSIAEPASGPEVDRPREAAPAVEAVAPVLAVDAVPAEPPRRRLRRVREYLQVKRDGNVVEELVAEDLIEVDEDPEPVRVRLRDQLHQQAVERGLE